MCKRKTTNMFLCSWSDLLFCLNLVREYEFTWIFIYLSKFEIKKRTWMSNLLQLSWLLIVDLRFFIIPMYIKLSKVEIQRKNF